MGVWFAVKKTLRKPQFWFGFTMILPLLIWYWIFSFGPIIQAFRMSTVAYKLLGPRQQSICRTGQFYQNLSAPPVLGLGEEYDSVGRLFVRISSAFGHANRCLFVQGQAGGATSIRR